MSLSTKKEELLLKGCRNGGRVTTKMARKHYASNNSGDSAIASLELNGYIRQVRAGGIPVSGSFEIIKLPDEVKEEFIEWKKNREDSE